MADLCRSLSLQEDPLRAYSGLSLFPRTLKSSSVPALTPTTLSQSDDLHRTNALLESMPFDIRKEHQEQAKAILDENSQLFKQGVESSLASEGTSVGVEMDLILNKRERRIGLVSKRRHSIFKPTTSQPSQNEPVFDASKYTTHEDYMKALTRHKNAQHEWQKQCGTLGTGTHQNQPPRRPRRQDIQGRKRVSYKNTYTDDYLTDLKASENEKIISSEEILETTSVEHVTTPDKKGDDSPVNEDKKLENILGELLACSPDKLEGDAGVKLLEERLHIKTFDKEMLSLPKLPEFPDVKRLDFKRSNRRTALSDIQNFPKGIISHATQKNSQPSSSSNPPEDYISSPDSHILLPEDRQSTEVDLAKDLNVRFRSSSVAKNADEVITNASPSNVGTVQKSSREDGSDTHTGIHRSQSNPDENRDHCADDSILNGDSAIPEVNVDTQTIRNEGDVPISENEANGNTGREETNADINEETEQLNNLAEYASRESARIDHSTVEEDSIPIQQGESSKSPNSGPIQYDPMDVPFEEAEHIQRQHEEENNNADIASELQVENAQQEVHSSSNNESRKRKKSGSSDSSTKRSKTTHDKSEVNKQMKTRSHESGRKMQTRGVSNRREDEKKKKQVKKATRESKLFSRRKSLADAGTKWETGLRRSTRIKSRPLEYWRGEKFLYGRIHDSLTTVIGVKYASSDNGRSKKRNLKVKSFVSDDYKELVDLAALD